MCDWQLDNPAAILYVGANQEIDIAGVSRITVKRHGMAAYENEINFVRVQ